MKFVLISILLFISCSVREQNNTKAVSDLKNLQRERPINVSEDAQKINMGFEDAPVFAWVEVIGNLKVQDDIYDHILGLKYTYEEPKRVDTVYYETEGRIDLNKLQSNVKISLYPGDTTIKIITNSGKEFTLYMVLEIKSFKGKWISIPTCSKNKKSEFVSSGIIDIKIENLKGNQFKVLLRDDDGIRELTYSSDYSDINELSKLSFINLDNGRIHFINRNQFIKPLK